MYRYRNNLAQTTNTKTMKQETIDSYTKWSARPFKALAHIDADIMIDFAEYFADEQLKKKMPSDIDCLTQYDKLHNDSQQYAGWSNAIKWLKQQILKP